MNIDLDIIKRVIAGDASQQDHLQYRQWLEENPEAVRLIDKMKLASDKSTPYQMEDAEIDARWRRFEAKNHGNFSNKTRVMQIGKWSSIAAVVICLIALTISTYFGNVTNEDSINVGEEDIVLVSSNGNSMTLNDLESSSENVFGAVTVQDKEMVYQTDSSKVSSQDIEYHTLIVPHGKEYEIVLSDGSRVHMNATSRLRYPTSFTGQATRSVELSGEAYFDVTHNSKQPFKVLVNNGLTVKVYGTKFNINTYKQGSVETVLVEGSVSLLLPCGIEQFLTPSQMGIYNDGTVNIKTVDTQNYLSWTTGVYSFNEETLENILSSLAAWYGFKFEFEDQELRNDLYICNLPRNKNFKDAIETLQLAGAFQYKFIDNVLIIAK